MIDEHFDRTYRAGSRQLNAGIASLVRRLIRQARAAFSTLHDISFSAPWTHPHSH